MESVLKGDLSKSHDALLVLAAHCVVFLAAAGVLLAARDARGVYGKAVNQRLKQQGRAPAALPNGTLTVATTLFSGGAKARVRDAGVAVSGVSRGILSYL